MSKRIDPQKELVEANNKLYDQQDTVARNTEVLQQKELAITSKQTALLFQINNKTLSKKQYFEWRNEDS